MQSAGYSFAAFMKAEYGFTLVELLVVVAVIAITGVFVLSNFRTYGEDQNLKNAILNLQSQLRAAQTNATSGVKCGNTPGTAWQVVATASKVYLACPGFFGKEVKFGNNIVVYGVTGIGAGNNCPTTKQFIISFAPLSGRISFGSPPATNCTQLNITLRNQNSPTLNLKSLIIEQGGRIYAL